MPLISLSGTSQKIASNTMYQIAGKLITMTITIAVTVMVTRGYGREAYGDFNLMQIIPALFFIIADFGLNAIATRELSTDWDKAEKYLGNIITMRLVLSLAIIAVVGGALVFFPYPDQLKFGIRLTLFLVLTQALFAATNIIFQVKLRYDLSNIGLVVGSLVILALAGIFTFLKLSVVWISFSYVVGGLVTVLLNLWFIKRLRVKIALNFDKALWKKLIILSMPIGLSFIFSQINFKSDSILLSVMEIPERFGLNNSETVAVYGLPYKIFEVSLVIPTFFMNSVYPVFVRNMQVGKSRLYETFKKSLVIMLGMGIAVGIGSFILAPVIIGLLGGEEFSQSVPLLRILLGGAFIFYLTQPISWLIVTLGKQVYLPWVYLVSAVFNLIANILLIPKYSFYASSVLTWISEILILVLLAFAARKAWNSKYA